MRRCSPRQLGGDAAPSLGAAPGEARRASGVGAAWKTRPSLEGLTYKEHGLRLLLFSDLHIDAPFRWAPVELARERRRALREVLKRVIELAEAERVDAICGAGDLFEHEYFAADTGEFLRSTFAEANCPVLLVPGNHDWYSGSSLYAQVDWSDNVTVFTEDRLRPFELEDGFTVWGGAHRAPANTDNFLKDFRVARAGVNVGLFHGSERSGLGFQGEGKAPHAPFAATDVPAAGLVHALVGHFHSPVDGPWHTYPGNPEPLTFGESGERGAVIFDFDDGGRFTRDRRRVGVTAITEISIDVTGAKTADEVASIVQEALAGAEGVIRATVSGEVSPDVNVRLSDLKSVAPHLPGLLLRLGELRAAYDLESIADEKTVRGQFVRDVLASSLDEEFCRRVLTTGLRALDQRQDLEVM